MSTTDDRPKRMHWRNQDLFNALKEAGIIHENDYVRRVVIDVCVGRAVMIHVERYGDERLIQVIKNMDGVEVHCGKREEWDE